MNFEKPPSPEAESSIMTTEQVKETLRSLIDASAGLKVVDKELEKIDAAKKVGASIEDGLEDFLLNQQEGIGSYLAGSGI